MAPPVPARLRHFVDQALSAPSPMMPMATIAPATPPREVPAPGEVLETSPVIVFDPNTLITTVTVGATVARPFEDITKLMDPRAWAARTELWVRSEAVLLDSRERVVFDSDGLPEPDESRNQVDLLGETWRGALRETTDWNITETIVSKFDVLLNIDFDVRQSKTGDLALFMLDIDAVPLCNGKILVHEYSLLEALEGQLGYQKLAGGVEVDSGYALAIECEGGTTRVEVQKKLRYSDWTPYVDDERSLDPGQFLNYLAPGIAGVWINSLVRDGLRAPVALPNLRGA
jgi:hypothetical protein